MRVSRKMRRALVPAMVVLAAMAGACSHSGSAATPSGQQIARATFHTSGGEVRTAFLSVADTEAEREQGLMGRTSLARDGGEVFVFDGPVHTGFWMKDTLIPLSIAFWDASGRIVDVKEMAPCTSDLCPIYRPRAAYTHALEMNAGWFDQHEVRIGDQVELHVGTE
jgi:uncharacterized membrane protein (UPF0127 family)